VIKEMFEASVDGQSYDTERWGQYFRPAGVTAPAGSSSTNESAPATTYNTPAPAATTPIPNVVSSSFDDEEPAVASAPVEAKPASSDKAQDILAMIRARQKA
jgi:hypothetical protein